MYLFGEAYNTRFSCLGWYFLREKQRNDNPNSANRKPTDFSFRGKSSKTEASCVSYGAWKWTVFIAVKKWNWSSGRYADVRVHPALVFHFSPLAPSLCSTGSCSAVQGETEALPARLWCSHLPCRTEIARADLPGARWGVWQVRWVREDELHAGAPAEGVLELIRAVWVLRPARAERRDDAAPKERLSSRLDLELSLRLHGCQENGPRQSSTDQRCGSPGSDTRKEW